MSKEIELPHIDRFDYVGGSYPMGLRQEGEYVEYDDHAAIVRQFVEQSSARSPSYDALLIIVQSVCGALERAGLTDCDDPGEAIDVMRERYESRLRKSNEQRAALLEALVRLHADTSSLMAGRGVRCMDETMSEAQAAIALAQGDAA